MALNYLLVDRDQPFLLPPSVREWLSEGHLAWFVVDVVDEIDTSVLHARHPNAGPGRAAYDPEMLLGLLLYGYCTGVRSSRQIERLCEVDVAFRVIAANRAPDHTTVARFRQSCDDLLEVLFVDVLALCAKAGMAKVGVVAVDGTKMGADAAMSANRSRDQLGAEVRAILDEAAEIDAAEDERFGDRRGDELPPELADPRTRGARLRAALAELDARRAATDAAEAEARAERVKTARDEGRRRGRTPKWADEVAEAEAALGRALDQQAAQRAEIEARAAAQGRRPHGPAPTESSRVKQARARLERARRRTQDRDEPPPEPEARTNTTDPASRMMKTPTGWIQGYNAQAAVNENGVVLGGDVTQDPNDVAQLEPMMRKTEDNLEAADVDDEIDTMLFDAGYWSLHNITCPGPDRLIADTKRGKLSKPATNEAPPIDASPLEAMRHQLRTPEGAARYAKRSSIVEPVFGQHKEARGFRRFTRRGLDAVRAEWHLINATHNMLKLYRARTAAP
jgi:transposase